MKKLILSCFGLGFLPIAPGTWGSLLPVGLFLVVHSIWPNGCILSMILAAMIIVSSILCILLAGEAEKIANKKDPGWVVIDEFAGQAITLLPIVFMTEKIPLMTAAAFVFFRIFDILKPTPIRRLEKLGGGVGILADDLLAGVYAAIALWLFRSLIL
ncbi:MAG: phosphatidylglycerophosphatase A [Phycisphaerae bacterium]|nr:phosphatidylglycerophosphatase A [Phycisphaerae bacterium]